MLAREPEEVARFLAKTQGLNKTMIGEYLGEREDTCLKVMHAYVDAMDFSGAAFDQAIRCDSHSTFPQTCDCGPSNLQERCWHPAWSSSGVKHFASNSHSPKCGAMQP